MVPTTPRRDAPERIDTERLRLEPYRPGDGAWLHVALERDRHHMAASLAGIRDGLGLDLTDPRDAEIFVRQLGRDWVAGQRFVYAVRERQSSEFVGELWVETVDWSVPLLEIGYFVLEAHLGKGYATEAARAGVHMLFRDLKAAKVRVTTDAANVASARVAERCGFTLEGRHRNESKRADGSLVDTLHYGMLPDEFDARQGEKRRRRQGLSEE